MNFNPWPCMALFWYFYPLETFELDFFHLNFQHKLYYFYTPSSLTSLLKFASRDGHFFFLSQPVPNKVNGSKFFYPSFIFAHNRNKKKVLTACSLPRFSILPLSEETSFPNDKSLLEVCATPILVMGSVMGLSKWLLQSKSRRPMGKNPDYRNGIWTYLWARCWNVH